MKSRKGTGRWDLLVLLGILILLVSITCSLWYNGLDREREFSEKLDSLEYAARTVNELVYQREIEGEVIAAVTETPDRLRVDIKILPQMTLNERGDETEIRIRVVRSDGWEMEISAEKLEQLKDELLRKYVQFEPQE